MSIYIISKTLNGGWKKIDYFCSRAPKKVCVLCDEVMQSPICALCQTDKVENWIDKKRVATIKEFRNEIRAFLDTVRRYNKLSCTYCRLESNTSVCQGCYNERVYTW